MDARKIDVIYVGGEVSPYAAMVARRAESTHATIRVYPHSGGSIAAPATPGSRPPRTVSNALLAC